MKNLIIIVLLTISTVVMAQYREYETEYFRMVYTEEYEHEVVQMNGYIDEKAEEILSFFNYTPKKKIAIIVNDNSDLINEMVINNTIFINPTPILTIGDEKYYSNWLENRFIHELTHVVLNRKNNGWIAKIPLMKYDIHQFLLPSWYLEGVATYSEVKFSDNKQNLLDLSQRYEMVERSAIEEGNFNGLKHANGMHMNMDNYIYGYSFIKFYSETYGETNLVKAIDYNSENQLNQPFKSFAEIAKLDSEDELYEQWNLYLDTKYKSTQDLVEGETIDAISIGNKKSLIHRNSKLYYLEHSEEKFGVYQYDIQEGTEKNIVLDYVGENFEVFGDDIYYSAIRENPVEMTTYFESYKKEIGKLFKRSHIETARVIAHIKLADETVIAYREKGKQGLKTSNGEILISTEEGYLFQKFYYEIESNKLYFSAIKSDDKSNYIYSFDLENQRIEKLIEGFSPYVTDDELYFANTVNGKRDIFKYDIKKDELLQITNVKYGAFEPIVINSELYYINYVGKGSRINKLKRDKFYNKLIKKGIQQETAITKENLGNNVNKKSEDTDEKHLQKLNSKKLNDSFQYRGGVLLPGQLSLFYSNTLLDKNIVFGYSDSLTESFKETDNDTGVYYFEEGDTESGLFVNYIDNRWNLYAEGEYGKVNFNYPIINRSKTKVFLGELSFDSEEEKSISLYMLQNSLLSEIRLTRTIDEEESDLNSLYLDANIFRLNYSWAAEERKISGFSNEKTMLNKGKSQQLRYNVYSESLFELSGELEQRFSLDKGSVSGKTILNDYVVDLGLYYFKWSDSGKKLIYDLSTGVDMFILTNIPLELRVGYINQYDLKREKYEADSDMLYLSYGISF